jgi:hypothetical protein
MANPRKKVIKNTLFNEYKRGDISQEDNNALNLINSQYAKDMIQQGALSGELNKGFVKRYEKKADRAYNQYSNPSARAQWDNAGTTKPDEKQMELYNSLNARDKGTRYGNMKKANNLEGVSLAYKMPNMTGQSKTLATAPREKLQQVDMNNALGKKFERATSGSIPEESYTEPTQMMSTTTSAMKGMNKDGSYYGLNNDELMFEARQKAKLGQTKQKEMNYPMKKAKNSYKYGGKMTYNGIKLK